MPAWERDERRLLSYLAATACLLFFFALALGAALAKSPTTDEPLHLLRGLLLQQTGDLSMQYEHGPLSHRLAGVLLASEGQVPAVQQLATWASGDRGEISQELLWRTGIDVQRMLFLARLAMVLAGVLLGSLIGSWALAWQKRWGMVIALTLFAGAPNLIAHAALVTTDLVATVTYFAAVYTWWRYLKWRKTRWWLLTAVFLGLALATKLTAVLLLPVLFLQLLLFATKRRELGRLLAAWLGALPIALLVLWLIYGLEMGRVSFLPFSIPAATYARSWQAVLSHVAGGHLAFFWGELSKRGWWYYFPLTFLIKTPLVTLLLLLTAVVVVLQRRALWRTAVVLLIPVGALFAAAMVSRLNIGYRHIMPALPFLLVLAATSWLGVRRWRLTRALLGLLLAWSLISAVRQHPHHLAYFNEAVGGTAAGYRYLGDSNLDWGQDLKLLAERVSSQEGEWRVSYYGAGEPAYYGLGEDVIIDLDAARETLAMANPAPGLYAISVNHLQGQTPDADLFDWFRRREPAYHLGGSIQVYEVQAQARGEWAAQCLDPGPSLAAEEAEQLLGSDDLRHLTFDCRQSLVLAGDGAPGWLILPQAEQWWFGEAVPLLASQLELVYRHDAAAGLPSFDVYYWPGADSAQLAEGWQRSGEQEGQAVSLPQALNDVAQLAGYRVDGRDWSTLWLITGAIEEPLSLQAHLYKEAGSAPTVGDSLGFSSEQWQAGDWLLQRFSFGEAEEGLYLETGLYNFQTLETIGETINLAAEERRR